MLNLTLIDADSIYFRQACVTKNKKDLRTGIDHVMNQIKRDCLSDQLMVAVKGHGNFRKDLFPKYKANRKPQPDDMKEALTYAHDYMCKKWDAVMADGMEADDLVAIWAYEAREAETAYVIAGIDKDLLQIPGHHYNFVKRMHSDVDDDQAHLSLMLQCLKVRATFRSSSISLRLALYLGNRSLRKFPCPFTATNTKHTPVSYTHLTLPTNREV